MPDENKLQALSDAGFQVKRTCYRCAFYDGGAGSWGTCRKITYKHKKHTATEKPRQVSVPIDGWCPMHETWLEVEALLRGYRPFVEQGGFPDPCKCGKKATVFHKAEALCFECFDRALDKRGP